MKYIRVCFCTKVVAHEEAYTKARLSTPTDPWGPRGFFGLWPMFFLPEARCQLKDGKIIS